MESATLTSLKKFLSHIYVPVIWTLIIIILLCIPGSLLPDQSKFKIPNLDKFVHIGLFGGLVFFWCFYFHSKHLQVQKQLVYFFGAFIFAAVLGIGMEFVQKYFIPNRSFDEGDIIADIIGAAALYGCCNIILPWLESSEGK